MIRIEWNKYFTKIEIDAFSTDISEFESLC